MLTELIQNAVRIVPKCNIQPTRTPLISLSETAGDSVAINPQQKIRYLKERLTKVLSSEHTSMPDYMQFISADASEEETVKYLQEMFQYSKFFSRVSFCEGHYGKNLRYAIMIGELSKKASVSILKGKSFSNVTDQIAHGYSKVSLEINKWKAAKCGKYRGSLIERIKNRDSIGFITEYGPNSRSRGYTEYTERLNNNLGKRVSPYKNFVLTCEYGPNIMLHPYPDEVAGNMKIISEKYKIYQSLVEEYKKTGQLTTERRAQADSIISEIYYLMANTCPFWRGSNGISDVLMRSQYQALGINKPHVKKGVGLDFEAFCMNLDEYKSKWNTFFET